MFVLRSDLPWEMLPGAAFGCSGMTCRRRLRDWQNAGVWDRLHQVLLERLDRAGELDWSRAALDAVSIGGGKGGAETGRSPAVSDRWRPPACPTDRSRAGTKRHCVTDRHGTPLGPTLTGAIRHDSMAPAPTLDPVPGVRSGQRGRPRKRPDKLHAPFGTLLAIPCRAVDKASDQRSCCKECRARLMTPGIARRSFETSARPGRHRWVVERTFAWFAQFKRLATRYDRRADIRMAFTKLATGVICINQISRFF